MITASVGNGGTNLPADVATIQGLLNARNSAGLAVNGVCDPATIAAVETFQALVRGITHPDGLITPGGLTETALSTGPTPAAATPATQPSLPGPTTLLVDLSHNNAGVPNFAALATAGVTAVLLKATQGTGFVDHTFASRLAAARAAGLLVGAYHYGTSADPAAQLAHFTAVVLAQPGTDFTNTLTALDVEINGTDTMSVDQAEAWVAGYRATYQATPLAYGGSDHLGTSGGATTRPNLAACPLWVPRYPNDPAARPAPVAGWADWTFWQYTTGIGGCYAGPVGGLTSDRSIYRGDAASLATAWRRWLA